MSMIDLSEKLRAARRHPAWSSESLQATLTRLGEAIPGSKVDHDEEAGEEWGRLLVSDEIVAIEREAISDAVDPDKLSASEIWWATT